MSSKWWGAIAALAPMLSGCLAATLWDVDKVPQDDQVIDTRVSSRQADLGGTSCYVERQHRVTSRIEIADRPALALGAILEALFGLAETGYAPNGSTDQYIGGAMATDGLLTIGYIIFRDGKATVSTHWDQTSETASCAH